jgi:hypothetical protein
VYIGWCRITVAQSTAARFCSTCPAVKWYQLMSIGSGSPVGHSTNGSEGVTSAIIAARCGGCSTAVSHWIRPL